MSNNRTPLHRSSFLLESLQTQHLNPIGLQITGPTCCFSILSCILTMLKTFIRTKNNKLMLVGFLILLYSFKSLCYRSFVMTCEYVCCVRDYML
ncbi:hypothetical protein L1987_45272 [Smallanthus sonchifolius]|uniref:Uncharacterized protein n=1 Tax=Smallanthus sonchifolius TaxID=185202 RepID=A0ACB9GSF3_9ASTR|nr:hypothetical protein L1987_45272 [Smallanthus sonchifolius]